MGKLKELWIAQSNFLNTLKLAAEGVKNVTRQKIRQFGWILNDTELRIEKEIQVLSDVPWKNTGSSKIQPAVRVA